MVGGNDTISGPKQTPVRPLAFDVHVRVLWLDDDFAAKRGFFYISVSVSYCFALDFDHSHTRIASQFEFTHAVHVVGFNLPTHIRVAFSIYQSQFFSIFNLPASF